MMKSNYFNSIDIKSQITSNPLKDNNKVASNISL